MLVGRRRRQRLETAEQIEEALREQGREQSRKAVRKAMNKMKGTPLTQAQIDEVVNSIPTLKPD